jgi:hypothetical protein
MRLVLVILLSTFSIVFCQAQDVKNIRGQVVDKDSKYPIIGASIIVIGSKPFNGTTTDIEGNFLIAQCATW